VKADSLTSLTIVVGHSVIMDISRSLIKLRARPRRRSCRCKDLK